MLGGYLESKELTYMGALQPSTLQDHKPRRAFLNMSLVKHGHHLQAC